MPDIRAWTGAGWQARTFVYILAPDAAHDMAMTAAGGPLLQAARPSSFTVHTGRRYRATLNLNGFYQLASNDMVAAELQRYGFTDVSVSALISSCENWRPIAAPSCAISRTGANRLHRSPIRVRASPSIGRIGSRLNSE